MRYREQLNITLMRDKGPRRTYRMRMSHFVWLMIFFGCMPVLCALLAWQCAELWDQNQVLRANMERFETDYQLAEAKAEKLAHLEDLLNESSVPGRENILRRLAANDTQKSEFIQNEEIQDTDMLDEGPGHEEFTIIDNGRVKVSNVQIRKLRGNTLRIGLDLRNPDNEQLLAGEVEATLVTAGGEKIPLVFEPVEAGSFRINRFKRATMVVHLGRDINLANSQVIIDVKDTNNAQLYRNIYAVQR